MTNRMRLLALLVIPFTLLLGCSGGKMDGKKNVFTSLKEIPETTWKKLSEKRIYFGHQSVGENIVAGIQDLMKENPSIKLNIVETTDPGEFKVPIFAHSKVGKNLYPESKCDAFADFMQKGIGDKTDIALLKFCYVDVMANTDINSVFDYYRNTISRLKGKYPKTIFVHVTVPLTTVETGKKVWIKKILGRPVYGYPDNMKRGQFNAELRKEFGGKEPIFDLAGAESTYPDGTRATFDNGGKTYYRMIPEYTTDGGHLNEKGRRLVAEQLLVLLADLAK
jgi:hypothetical protein